MKKTIIILIILGYLVIIYIPSMGLKIDKFIGYNFNQKVIILIDKGLFKIVLLKNYLNKKIDNLSLKDIK